MSLPSQTKSRDAAHTPKEQIASIHLAKARTQRRQCLHVPIKFSCFIGMAMVRDSALNLRDETYSLKSEKQHQAWCLEKIH